MKKLILTLAILMSFVQEASAIDLDTVWSKALFPQKCYFATFSPDTNKIIAAMGSTIYYLDAHTGDIIDSFQKAAGPIATNEISISFNKKRISAICDNGTYIWDTTTKDIIKIFSNQDTNFVVGINALSPDGTYFVCRTWVKNKHPNQNNPYDTARILVYDLDADTVVKWINLDYDGLPEYIAYSPDGNSFVISFKLYSSPNSYWYNLTKYTTNGWQIDTVLEDRQDSYYSYISFSSDGRYMAGTKIDTGCSNYVWDLFADTLFRTYPRTKLGGYAYDIINFSSNNQYLLFGSGDPFLDSKPHNQIWDFINDTSVFSFGSYSKSAYSYSNITGYILVANEFAIYLFNPNWQPSSVFEPTEKSDDIKIAQKNKTLIVKSKDFDLRKIEIYDVMGSLVLSKTADSEEIAVSMQGMQSGIYFVKVQTAKQVFVRKVLVVE